MTLEELAKWWQKMLESEEFPSGMNARIVATVAACRELANKRQECRCEEDGPGDSLEAATDAALAEISNG